MGSSGKHKASARAGNAAYTAKHGWGARTAKIRAQFLSELVASGAITEVTAKGIKADKNAPPKGCKTDENALKGAKTDKNAIKGFAANQKAAKSVKTDKNAPKDLETSNNVSLANVSLAGAGLADAGLAERLEADVSLADQLRHAVQLLKQKDELLKQKDEQAAAANAAADVEFSRLKVDAEIAKLEWSKVARRLSNLEDARDMVGTMIATGSVISREYLRSLKYQPASAIKYPWKR